MRMYSDSADAIKAYSEETMLDIYSDDIVYTELQESADNQRGGLKLEFKNYHKEPMEVTIIHTWLDTFSVKFFTPSKGANTVQDIHANDLLGLFDSLAVALTGVTREEWQRLVYAANKEEE